MASRVCSMCLDLGLYLDLLQATIVINEVHIRITSCYHDGAHQAHVDAIDMR